jgi:hypothetical protein
MEKEKLSNYANETSMSDQIIQYMTCHKLLHQLWRCNWDTEMLLLKADHLE